MGMLLGFIVHQVYLNEGEDDVTRKKIGGREGRNFADRKELRVVIPGFVAALPGLGSGE